jgi:hypothetical protein
MTSQKEAFHAPEASEAFQIEALRKLTPKKVYNMAFAAVKGGNLADFQNAIRALGQVVIDDMVVDIPWKKFLDIAACNGNVGIVKMITHDACRVDCANAIAIAIWNKHQNIVDILTAYSPLTYELSKVSMLGKKEIEAKE